MKTQYNQDKTALKIYGDHSPHPVMLTTDVFNEYFEGDASNAFHTIKNWHKKNLLASTGIFDKSNLKYTVNNVCFNKRFWQWVNIQRWNQIFWGYAHKEGGKYIFCDGTIV